MNGHGILVNGTDETAQDRRHRRMGGARLHRHGAGDHEPDPSDRVQEPRFLPRKGQRPTSGTATSTRSPGRCTSSTWAWSTSRAATALALGSLTLDTGVGVDDLLAVCMSRGDVLIYAGTDPSYGKRLANQRPIQARSRDRRPATRQARGRPDRHHERTDTYLFSNFSVPAENNASWPSLTRSPPPSRYPSSPSEAWPGGKRFFFSEANWLLFNVPEDDGGSRFIQHTMNVQTGAWCSFRGMNARCWETYKGKLYFGTGAGKVMQADTGGSDGDASISGLVRSPPTTTCKVAL